MNAPSGHPRSPLDHVRAPRRVEWRALTNRAPPLALLAILLCLCAIPLPASVAASIASEGADTAHSPAAAERQACLRCHAMPTLAYREPTTGDIVSLHIDPHALADSVHGQLACLDCHRRSYRRYPHPERAAPREFDCIGCHRDDDADLGRQWLGIDAEFQRSVHAVSTSPRAANFDCHTCHDPHRFRPAAVGEPLTEIVARHNAVCLSCHRRLLEPQRRSHAWLPNRDAHWQAVRCIDCHTPPAREANHEVLAAEQTERNCVGCHSSDPRLLAGLYRFRSEEEIARRGLLAQALFNEAYVIGMSRSPLLDRLSLIILGLLILALAAHGIGRYLVHRAGRDSRGRA
ncbi:MAG: nitrate reductase [Sphingobacteriia bacterium]|nr:nitrate reductase [Sphingobacteriia bacterium]NCC39732.1 nitrate reductase [Gammaproteobacteria bacterium]